MTVQDYIDYFENEALQSENINHTSDNEGERGFFYIEWEKLLANLPSGIQIEDGSPNTILFAIVPNFGYVGQPSNFLKDYEAGYMVLQKVNEVNDMVQVATALSNTEKIVDEINLRIINKSLNNHELFTAEIDGTAFKVSPVLRKHDNYYGLVCQFDFQSFRTTCIDGNNWKDLSNQNKPVY